MVWVILDPACDYPGESWINVATTPPAKQLHCPTMVNFWVVTVVSVGKILIVDSFPKENCPPQKLNHMEIVVLPCFSSWLKLMFFAFYTQNW